jgi:hypothetical protein
MLPFAGDASRAMPPLFNPDGSKAPPPPGFTGDASRAAPPFTPGASRPLPPFNPAGPGPIPPPYGSDPARGAPPFNPASPGPIPPPYGSDPARGAPFGHDLRSRPPSIPPPFPPVSTPPPGHGGAHTQISFVPPMPDMDPLTAAPTTLLGPDGRPASGAPLGDSAMTPVAPPPMPADGLPRDRRDSQTPAMRNHPATRPPLRAAVPMPARPMRTGANPTQPPPPGRSPSPRPTLAMSVPPIPAIPSIPPAPAPAADPSSSLLNKRPDTDGLTDPDGRASDAETATVSRAPIEVGEYTAETNISGSPASDHGLDHLRVSDPRLEAALANGDGRGTYLLDDRGQPVERRTPAHADIALHTSPSARVDADEAATITHAPDPAALAASRPTVQRAAERPPELPTMVAPPISPAIARATTPQAHDRLAPKLPISTAPSSLPPPKDNKQALGPSPACPQCESPMAWVEEHLRFYCKLCRMYF